MRALVSLLLSCACLPGCSLFGYERHETIGEVAISTVRDSNQMEIQVPYRDFGRGNVHNPFTYKKWESVQADWIVIDNPQGLSVLDGKRKMPCPSGYNRWYSGTEIRGTVEVKGSSIRIELSVPAQDHPGWAPYEFNGTWPLNTNSMSTKQLSEWNHEHNCEPPSL